jgi:hypothetical protein
MISTTLLPVLALATTLFTAPTTAFPARTNCRCTITETNPHFLPESLPTPEYTDSSPPDICSPLGPELEDLRAVKPDEYAALISHRHTTTTTSANATSTKEERPASTTILLQIAARSKLGTLGVVLPSAPATVRTGQMIVCKTEIRSFSKYQDSLITLFVVQVIVGLAVLACIAECVTLALRWYVICILTQSPCYVLTVACRMSGSAEEHIPNKPALRLSGEEKRLLAIPGVEEICSPGLDKKLRLYRNGDWTPKLASGKREFEAYVVEEDDDELSRPVM